MRLFYYEKCYDNLFDYLQYLFIVTLNRSLNELIFFPLLDKFFVYITVDRGASNRCNHIGGATQYLIKTNLKR